jgi:hypothetical protein
MVGVGEVDFVILSHAGRGVRGVNSPTVRARRVRGSFDPDYSAELSDVAEVSES